MNPLFEVDTQDQFKSYSLKDIVGLFFKHKSIILSSFFIIAICVNLMLFYIPSVYETHATVLIRPELQGTPTFFAGVASIKDATQDDPIKRKIETEMAMIEAREIAEQVVRELNVQWDQVYHKPIVHLLEPVAEHIIDPFLGLFGILPDPENKGFDDTVKELIKSIQIAPGLSKSADTNPNTIAVGIKSPDSEVGRDILLRILEVYLEYDIKVNRESAQKAYALVDDKLQKSFRNLSEAQAALNQFLANKDTEALNTRDVSSLLTSPNDMSTIQILKEEILKLEFNLIDVTDRFREEDSNILRIKKSIRDLSVRLSQELELYADNDTILHTLERDLDLEESIYLALKKRLSEIDLFIEMNEYSLSSRTILAPPLAPRESSWKKDVVLGIFGSIVGLLFGVTLAGIREFLDDSIRDEADVAKHLGIELIGKIPEEKISSINDFLSTN